jgi:AcrR family transcriptional regulator
MNRVHDETSEALLVAAHRLLASDGPDSLTVRRIATEAGMSTMNVYSRFGGKDGVIDELYAHGYQLLFDALEAVPETADTAADLIAIAAAYRTFALESPMYYEIMFGKFDPSEQSIETALEGLARLVGRLDRGIANGSLRLPDDLDTAGATAWLWATCHGLISLELGNIAVETIDWSAIFATAIHTAVSSLSPLGVAPSTA